MKLTEIQTLMKQFEDSEMRELKIDDNDFHLYLSKNKLNHAEQVAKPVVKDPSTSEPETSSKSVSTEIQAKKAAPENATAVKAPLVGVVYLQAKPGQPPYVKVGDHVNKGDTICIIEAMKIEIPIVAPKRMRVDQVLIHQGDTVKTGQALLVLAPE